MERVTAEPPKRTIWQRIFGIRTDYSWQSRDMPYNQGVTPNQITRKRPCTQLVSQPVSRGFFMGRWKVTWGESRWKTNKTGARANTTNSWNRWNMLP
jgi:hypothetical protein